MINTAYSIDLNMPYGFAEGQYAVLILQNTPRFDTSYLTGGYGVSVDLSEQGNMKMKPDIENTTISEYLKYDATKERRLWDNVRSRRSPTNYNEADVDSFYSNKSKTFSYSYSYNLTPPHTCFLPIQPYPFVSTNGSNDVDIENMTITEYNLYVAKQGIGMNALSNHSYGFTPQFFAQPPHTPNTSKKDSDFDKIWDDLFRTGAENMKQIGHDIVQDSIWEQDDDSEEDQEEDGDDGDTFDMWDITVEEVECIRKFFNIPDEIDEIVQPLIPEPIHTTLPNDNYVAPATKFILDELLEEFRDEILNVTMVDDEVDFNPTKDLEELKRLLAKEPQSNFTEIQGYNSEETNFEVTSTRNYVLYRLCPCGGAWILNKLLGGIANRTSWMLYWWLVMLHVGYCSRKQTWSMA
ncbi:hypothetical protein Tco_0072476 [Tanacetum coccineum]